MIKQINFFIKNIARTFFEALISVITIRDKNIVVMGLRTPITKLKKYSKDYFMHNTKYMFLCQQELFGLKIVYLCDDNNITKNLKKCGFKNIYKRNSLKGVYYTLRAKYWLYDDSKKGVFNHILSGGATCINLWHGVPLKKIGFDITGNYKNYNKFQKCIHDLLRPKDSFYNVNSEYEQSSYETAFLTAKDNIKILGSPRLDVLLHDIPHSDLFMEDDFAKIKSFKEQGKNLIFYTPTFRDTGKDISGWLKSDRLKQFLKQNNAILVCKLHFADKNSLNFELTEEFYKMDSNSDIYPVLKYSDALISDYSSIAFDYLLLDKSIIYHVPDLQEYQDTCRGFYMPYEEFAVGEITRNEEEILSAMKKVIDGVDNYKEQRKVLRDRMFKYQDGKNCERVVEWIKSLDK